MVFAHTNGMGMIVARNRLCLNSNTYRALSSPQVEPHIHLTESSRPYPSSSITNYVQLSFNSAEPGYNQTFTKFVDCKKHEVTQSVDGYIYAWPGCDFATMMKTTRARNATSVNITITSARLTTLLSSHATTCLCSSSARS